MTRKLIPVLVLLNLEWLELHSSWYHHWRGASGALAAQVLFYVANQRTVVPAPNWLCPSWLTVVAVVSWWGMGDSQNPSHGTEDQVEFVCIAMLTSAMSRMSSPWEEWARRVGTMTRNNESWFRRVEPGTRNVGVGFGIWGVGWCPTLVLLDLSALRMVCYRRQRRSINHQHSRWLVR